LSVEKQHLYEPGFLTVSNCNCRTPSKCACRSSPHCENIKSRTRCFKCLLNCCKYVSNKCIAFRRVATPLRELTCHMGSHSVTCHPAEVTFPALPQPKLCADVICNLKVSKKVRDYLTPSVGSSHSQHSSVVSLSSSIVVDWPLHYICRSDFFSTPP